MLQAVGDECQVLEVHEEVFGLGDGSLGCRVVAAPKALHYYVLARRVGEVSRNVAG